MKTEGWEGNVGRSITVPPGNLRRILNAGGWEKGKQITGIHKNFSFKLCLRKQTFMKTNLTKEKNHLFNCFQCIIIIIFAFLL